MGEMQFIRVSVEERVAVVTIDHPPVNALNTATLEELNAAIDQVIADAHVKAVVVTGAGQLAFVAGADITEFTKLETTDQAKTISRQVQAVFTKIENAPKPFIAAINGVALGGGLELALACHLRIIGDRAKVGQPEINLGIIPGWGGTQRLPRLVGRAKALEFILTGDSVTPQEAYRLNLVNKVVPGGEVLKTAKDLARKIAQKGALASRAALKAVNGGEGKSLEEGLRLEAETFAEISLSADAREGVAAFLGKRQAVFTDQ
jgi:enoyl-CoA hydratase/carnithine racemase